MSTDTTPADTSAPETPPRDEIEIHGRPYVRNYCHSQWFEIRDLSTGRWWKQQGASGFGDDMGEPTAWKCERSISGTATLINVRRTRDVKLALCDAEEVAKEISVQIYPAPEDGTLRVLPGEGWERKDVRGHTGLHHDQPDWETGFKGGWSMFVYLPESVFEDISREIREGRANLLVMDAKLDLYGDEAVFKYGSGSDHYDWYLPKAKSGRAYTSVGLTHSVMPAKVTPKQEDEAEVIEDEPKPVPVPAVPPQVLALLTSISGSLKVVMWLLALVVFGMVIGRHW